jgi:molybdopterin synthase sulfur carrier subunit
MIRVLFFARIREQLGASELHLGQVPATVAALVDLLEAERGTAFAAPLRAANVLVAVNHEVAGRAHALKPGDEVAFYPPVTGG